MERDELLRKLGDRIRELRLEKGMSQAELARQCGKDPQSIERIENAKVNPTVVTLHQISEVIGVSVDQLMKF